jgi:hypothetical protein
MTPHNVEWETLALTCQRACWFRQNNGDTILLQHQLFLLCHLGIKIMHLGEMVIFGTCWWGSILPLLSRSMYRALILHQQHKCMLPQWCRLSFSIKAADFVANNIIQTGGFNRHPKHSNPVSCLPPQLGHHSCPVLWVPVMLVLACWLKTRSCLGTLLGSAIKVNVESFPLPSPLPCLCYAFGLTFPWCW